MKYDDFHDLIRSNGWKKIRHNGTSHIIYGKEGITYPVPYHKGKELGKGLECKIRKEMKLKNI